MEATIAEKPVIKVTALCGSLRKASFNRGLIRSGFLHFTVLFTMYDFFERSFDLCFLVAAIKISKEAINGMEIEYVDVEPLPMLNTDLEVDGTYPPAGGLPDGWSSGAMPPLIEGAETHCPPHLRLRSASSTCQGPKSRNGSMST